MTKIEEENRQRELAYYQALAQGRDAAGWRETAEAFRLRNMTLMDQIDDLRGKNSALLTVLRAVEWGAADYNEAHCCPECWSLPSEGHAADCEVGKVLARYPTPQNVTAHDRDGSTTSHVARSTENGTV